MPNYNKVIILGNLTRDPELRYLQQGTAIAEFGIAVNRKFTTKTGAERDETLFVDVTAWGKQAETLAEYVNKGTSLLIEGRLKLDTWQDKNTGDKRSKHSITLEQFQFVTPKSDAEPKPSRRKPVYDDDIPF